MRVLVCRIIDDLLGFDQNFAEWEKSRLMNQWMLADLVDVLRDLNQII